MNSDEYRRYRQRSANEEKDELFSGSNQYPSNQSGYPQPSYGQGYSQYPPPNYYGQKQETEEDVEEIKSQLRTTKQESLASTQRSLQMINDAEVSAQKTLNKLSEQSHRINQTELQMDLADAHAERAAEQAAKLKRVNGSMFGFDISNPFTKKKREAAELERLQAMQEEQRANQNNVRAGNWETKQRVNNALKQSNQVQSQYPQSTTSSNRSKFQFEADDEDNALEDQLDNNLDSLSNGLNRLNAMAVASGEEIKKQSVVLDRISDKTNNLNDRIVGTTHTLKKIK